MALNPLINSISAHKARPDERIHRFLNSVSPYMHQHAHVGQKSFEREVTGGKVEASAQQKSSSQSRGSEWLPTRGELQAKLKRREAMTQDKGEDTSVVHNIVFSRTNGSRGAATSKERRPYDHQHYAPAQTGSSASLHQDVGVDHRHDEVQGDLRRHEAASRTHRLIRPLDRSDLDNEEQRRREGQRLADIDSQERESRQLIKILKQCFCTKGSPQESYSARYDDERKPQSLD